MSRRPSLIAAPFLGVLALGALAACAPMTAPGADAAATASTGARKCLFQDDVRSFRVSRESRSVYVRGLGKTVYRLEVMGACPELADALAIGFAPLSGGNNLCTGDYTRLVVGGSHAPLPCSVRMTGALSEAEVAALPERDRP